MTALEEVLVWKTDVNEAKAGGITEKRMLQKFNPMGTLGCDEEIT